MSGSGLLLVHDPELLSVIDQWLASVSDEVFDDVLPLLRRSFARFEQGERSQIARAVGHLDGGGPSGGALGLGAARRAGTGTGAYVEAGVDADRARAVLPVLRLLLGRQEPTAGTPAPGVPAGDDGGSRP